MTSSIWAVFVSGLMTTSLTSLRRR